LLVKKKSKQFASLSSRVQILTEAVHHFREKQSAVIDALVDLGHSDEFEKTDSPMTDSMELMYFKILDIVSLTSSSSSAVLTSTVVQSGHSLPKIELPKFDGLIINWRLFRVTYVSLVHINAGVSDIERFHYLLSCLSGSALSVIKSVPLSAANYSIAWQALNDRFENPRLLATVHVDQLFAFKPITHESVFSLTSFVNTFNENIAALKVLGVNDLAGFLLFYIGSRVLDSNKRQLFENTAQPNKMPNFDSLISFVQQRCKILENFRSAGNICKINLKCDKNYVSSKTSLAATIVSSSLKRCPLCKDSSHPLYRCSIFKKWTVNQRKEFVTSAKLCFSCLGPSHVVTACKSKSSCSTCGKRHHSLLHYRREISGEKIAANSNTPNVQAPPKVGNDTNFVSLSRLTNTVVLRPAVVHVLDRHGLPHPVRVLLDSGSQVSIITVECASLLEMPRSKCSTQVIGLSRNPVSKVKGKTTIKFTPHHSSHPFITSDEVIILPNITGLMPNESLPTFVRGKYEHLLLADPKFDVPTRIDMLIGSDIFPHIVRPRAEIIHHLGYPSA